MGGCSPETVGTFARILLLDMSVSLVGEPEEMEGFVQRHDALFGHLSCCFLLLSETDSLRNKHNQL